MFDHATMQRRFHDLGTQVAAIRAKSAPLRAERDKVLADIQGRVTALETEVKEIEKPLFDLEQERALIARALGGKTGKPE